ncbi:MULTISPECIES: hypothetical protein [Vibrio]|uniref:Uncharacterized protein n=1 Tax=Vibrio alginolyticus TaxID=663 RepID=A0A7Y0MZG8_VIBAL|nr:MULTISPECIES: hypothetical protein [Vibrio]MBM5118454.1 hypothetical protein [Vibrio parahaemolyticus]MBM5123413.1 hypothetical protein [Vibrio parahaemolyticus]MBM5132804.1 hypothetical protein [Vibrio parahaemolyticus]MBM5139025.1 hypothetical protein [Vibrio parahaemolyticus]MBT0009154.1 hypothetical protein [Vibrio alginolyticus]
MKQKTVNQIQARLSEIAQEQSQFEQRDFDAELLEVMSSGGDVDQLEQKQLEDERQARRLRVEKQALELELPVAKQREGLAELEVLKRDCEGDASLIAEQVDIINKAFDKDIKPALERLCQIEAKRYSALSRANTLTKQCGVQSSIVSYFGVLDSRRLKAIQEYIHAGREPESGTTFVTNGRFIEDLD